MRRAAMMVALAAAAVRPAFADDPLARARALYNQQQFEAAVTAAEEARVTPARADAADLVAARAYLERYRASQIKVPIRAFCLNGSEPAATQAKQVTLSF